MVGAVNVSDSDNGVYAEVKFDAMKEKRTGYWTSFIKGSDKLNKDTGKLDNRSDLLSISITDDADCQISTGEGSYLEQVVFDGGRVFWDINDLGMISDFHAPPANYII